MLLLSSSSESICDVVGSRCGVVEGDDRGVIPELLLVDFFTTALLFGGSSLRSCDSPDSSNLRFPIAEDVVTDYPDKRLGNSCSD